MLKWLGFEERIRGSHHIFRKQGIRELINLQHDGNKAKVYQIRQVRQIILRYRLEGDKGVKMHKYEIILYWSNEDQAFVAEVPELPGCMAHGNTQEAALVHANEVIQLWLDTAKEFGDPIPTPKGERLMLA